MTLKTGALITVAALFAVIFTACDATPDEAAPTAAPTTTPTPPIAAAPAPAPARPPPTPTSSPLPAPPPSVPSDGVLITASAGGRVHLGEADSPVLEIEIPPGALAADTAISIDEVTAGSLSPDANAVESVGPAFRLNPAGLQFVQPVTVTIRLDAAELGGIEVEAGVQPLLGLLRSEDGSWDLLRNSVTAVDPEAGSMTLSGETDHFTELVVVQGPLKVSMTPAQVGPIPARTSWSVNLTATNLSDRGHLDWQLGGCRVDGVVPRFPGGPCPFASDVLGPGLEKNLPAHGFECADAGSGAWEIRVRWSETDFVALTARTAAQFVPVLLDIAEGTVVLAGLAECVAALSETAVPVNPTDTPTPEPAAFVDFPALEPEFVDCGDGTPIPAADVPEIINAGEVMVRVGQSPPSIIAITIDMQAIVERANATGEGLPSVQVLIRDRDAEPLPDSPDWHFDNIYHNVVQLFLDDRITGYFQDVRTHEIIDLPTLQGSLEDGLLELKLPPDIFPPNADVAVGIISPDASDFAEYVFDGFEGPVVAPPVELLSPRNSGVPYTLSTNPGSSRVHLLFADFNCDTQPELYQVDELGRWRDIDLLGEDLGDEPLFSSPPGSRPFAGDWNGDGCDAPAAFFADGSGLAVFYDRLGGPPERSFFNAGDVRAPLLMDGGKPVVGDFDGDGIDDLGVFRDGLWKVAHPPGPLLNDLSVLTDPDLELDIFQFGSLNSTPLRGAHTGLLGGPDDGSELQHDDYFIIQWDAPAIYGCAPSATPCGVVFRLDWWEASGMAAFVIDANDDGSADLLACPADEDGLVEGGTVECWLLDDVDAFINENLVP